ncbi:MAG: 6-phospho-beta-glucosidase [Treponema sp.]|nr:6-phospho-beta-glucosidase [Treponema sp.]MCL2273003.1 6-phospho-beta-glucosidase [Treponema sp.]
MRKLKAAVIGAGSTYTPELIRGFIDRQNSLDFQKFFLADINREKLDIVGGLAKRMLTAKGFTGEIVLTQNLDEAISGADYIFAQIRVGGMEARIRDEKIPLKYGLLGQETTGAGGFMKAMRTIPVMLDIARRIEKLAPDAWLINFSNPSGIIAEALMNHSNIKMIGLCNCFVNMKAGIAKNIGREDFDYEYLGLNHLSWVTSVTVDGENVLDRLGKSAGAKLKNIPDVDYDDELLEAIPAIPSYYLSYFYLRDKQVQHCLNAKKTRGECCVDIESSLIEKYKDPNLIDKPKELEERGGSLYSTAAVSAVDAIENDKNEYHVVGVKNNGAIPFMADDDVVEIKCNLNRNGASSVTVKDPEIPYIKGLMQAVKAYEKLTVKAAINGSRKDAIAALMIHPLIGDFQKAKAVLDDMVTANAGYLPKSLLP